VVSRLPILLVIASHPPKPECRVHHPAEIPPLTADHVPGTVAAAHAERHYERQYQRHYAVVARAIAWLRAHYATQPTLEDLAAAVHLSPFHLQRVFAEWAGISPKRFLQVLTRDHALTRLRAAAGVLDVTAEVGLGSTSRLHDLMISCEALTPGEIRRGGAGVEVGFGNAPSPFGPVLVAWTGRGICHLVFCDDTPAAALEDLRQRWPAARLRRDDAAAHTVLARIFPTLPWRGTLHLVLRGTNFQVKVWEALLRTLPGDCVSYAALAHAAGSPGAQRAVGSALAANAIGVLIPCHRVIRASGEIGQYRWGVERKLALLGWEAARAGS